MRSLSRLAAPLLAAGLVAACDNSTGICAGSGTFGIILTITDAQGADVGSSTMLLVKRLDPPPVDSASGLHDLVHASPIYFTNDRPGRYYLRMERPGYQVAERTVVVPSAGECNVPVTQTVNVALVPN